MKHDCTNCARHAVGDSAVCGACDFSLTRDPTNWQPIEAPVGGTTDTQRLDWALALLDDSGPINGKLLALAAGMVQGLQGRDLIDYAMEGSPR